MVPRENLPEVEVILYEPVKKCCEPMPVLFNIHGGAWVGGDASALDTQSKQLADTCSCLVVNINYRKVDDKPFPYCQHEVRDTVLYFAEHVDEFGIDREKFTLIGYSAGGHICTGAAMLLRDAGFKLNSQVPCYPFLDFHLFDTDGIPGVEEENGEQKTDKKTEKKNRELMAVVNEIFFRGGVDKFSALMSPGAAAPEELKGVAPVELIICGKDALYEQAFAYQKRLEEANVPVELKVFEKATHGFMEGNYPEMFYEPNEEQRIIRDESFRYLKKQMEQHWR